MFNFFTQTAARCPSITAEDLNRLFENGTQLCLVDVREEDEYAEGSFPNVIHIPLGEIRQKLDQIPKDRLVIVVCRSGARSARVVWQLLEKGFKEVKNLQGGMIAWENMSGKD